MIRSVLFCISKVIKIIHFLCCHSSAISCSISSTGQTFGSFQSLVCRFIIAVCISLRAPCTLRIVGLLIYCTGLLVDLSWAGWNYPRSYGSVAVLRGRYLKGADYSVAPAAL